MRCRLVTLRRSPRFASRSPGTPCPVSDDVDDDVDDNVEDDNVDDEVDEGENRCAACTLPVLGPMEVHPW